MGTVSKGLVFVTGNGKASTANEVGLFSEGKWIYNNELQQLFVSRLVGAMGSVLKGFASATRAGPGRTVSSVGGIQRILCMIYSKNSYRYLPRPLQWSRILCWRALQVCQWLDWCELFVRSVQLSTWTEKQLTVVLGVGFSDSGSSEPRANWHNRKTQGLDRECSNHGGENSFTGDQDQWLPCGWKHDNHN